MRKIESKKKRQGLTSTGLKGNYPSEAIHLESGLDRNFNRGQAHGALLGDFFAIC